MPLAMLRRKGLYPYEWVDSEARFAETSLPSRECFYSKLADEMPSEKEYKHALEVWRATGCETFGQYHDLYLKLDVALLADVFESFRLSCLRDDGLDPAWYYTLARVLMV